MKNNLLKTPELENAALLALFHHNGMMYGDVPYADHLYEVLEVINEIRPDDNEMQVAALLHDAVEDTSLTTEKIWAHFGDRVTNLVNAVTSCKGSRKLRHEHMIKSLQKYPDAIPLKLADRVCNVRNCWKNRNTLLFVYQREYRDMRAELMPISGPECARLWQELDSMLGWWSGNKSI